MSFWFWLNVGAWCMVVIIALALVLMVLSAGFRRTSSFYFLIFNSAQTFSAVNATLLALALWLERGDPQRLTEFNALGATFAAIFLLMFAVRYFEFAPRTRLIMRIVSAGSLVGTLLLLWPLFQHRIIHSPRLSPPGIPITSFTSFGFVAALTPVICLTSAAVLFWRRKEAAGSRPMLYSVLAMIVGLVWGGLFHWSFPVFSVTTAVGMAILGYTVMNYQLFNPLQKLTADLEQRVAERTAALEKAYADLAMESAQSRAARAEAEQAQAEAEVANEALQAQIWLIAGQAQLSQRLHTIQDIPTLANQVICHLCEYLDASAGALYLLKDKVLTLAGAYTYRPPAAGPWQFALGEGLIGQVAQNRTPAYVYDLPEHYMTVLAGMGQIKLHHLAIVPFLYDRQVIGVIEMGTLHEFSPAHLEFLNLAAEAIAMTFYTLLARERWEGSCRIE